MQKQKYFKSSLPLPPAFINIPIAPLQFNRALVPVNLNYLCLSASPDRRYLFATKNLTLCCVCKHTLSLQALSTSQYVPGTMTKVF
jgi:hypothetical protein